MDPEQAVRLITTNAERHGRLDVVVDDASATPYAEAATASPLVRVNSLVVGPVDTGYMENLEHVTRSIPMGRMAAPDDVAEACLYLAPPQSAYMSGASLAVRGGGEWPAYLAPVREPGVPS